MDRDMKKQMQQEMQQNNKAEMTETIKKNQTDPSVTKWQLDGSDILQQARMKLEGKRFEYGENGKVIGVDQVSEPILNEEQIEDVMNLLNNYINKNVQLSEFTANEINHLMRNIKKDLIDYLALQHAKGELPMEKIYVVKHIANFIWAGLNRAKYGAEKTFIENTEQRQVSMDASRQNKGSWLNKLSPTG